MTLSNSKTSSYGTGNYTWGGCPPFTCQQTEAINCLRDDDNNINTLIFCCMDPLTADIAVFQHRCDPIRHGTYKFHSLTFHANDPKEYPTHGFGIP